MTLDRAAYLRELILRNGISDVLELGFLHGKSTAFMAATLEEAGRGHITTMDLETARDREPNIDQVLGSLGLSHRVTPVYAKTSFTWELGRLLKQPTPPQFDLVYIDGAHTWNGSGFAFLLADLMVRPGGFVLLDDLNWTQAASPSVRKNPQKYARVPPEELEAQQVRMVWELLLPRRGYINPVEISRFGWALAQKQPSQDGSRPDLPPESSLSAWQRLIRRRSRAAA